MKQRTKFSWACVVALGALVLTVSGVSAQDKMKALLVDGQNNHGNWPQTSQMMKSYLESSGLFEVEIARTAKKGTDPILFGTRFARRQLGNVGERSGLARYCLVGL